MLEFVSSDRPPLSALASLREVELARCGCARVKNLSLFSEMCSFNAFRTVQRILFRVIFYRVIPTDFRKKDVSFTICRRAKVLECVSILVNRSG